MAEHAGPARWVLLKDRDFAVYYLASTVSFLGMQVGRVVLPLLCFQLSGSAFLTSLLFTVQLVPSFAFGLFAGALADRVNRRTIMIIGYGAAGLTLAAIPALHLLNALTITAVYVAAFLSATAYTWAEAADMGAVPALVGRNRIVGAASLIHGTWTITGVVGLPLGGALAALIGTIGTIAINAAGFLILAALLPLIRRTLGPTRHSQPAPSPSVVRSILRDIAEGLHFVRHHPIQWPITVIGTIASIGVGAGLSLIVVYGVQQLQLPDNGGQIGLLYAAGAIGAFAAAAALPAISTRIPPGRIAITSQAVSAGLLALLAVTTSPPVSVLLLGLWEFTLTLAVLNTMSLRQRITPDRLQSRVNASVRLVAATGQALGGLLGGLLADVATVAIAYGAIAILLGMVAVAAALSPIRRITHTTVNLAMTEADADADHR